MLGLSLEMQLGIPRCCQRQYLIRVDEALTPVTRRRTTVAVVSIPPTVPTICLPAVALPAVAIPPVALPAVAFTAVAFTAVSGVTVSSMAVTAVALAVTAVSVLQSQSRQGSSVPLVVVQTPPAGRSSGWTWQFQRSSVSSSVCQTRR